MTRPFVKEKFITPLTSSPQSKLSLYSLSQIKKLQKVNRERSAHKPMTSTQPLNTASPPFFQLTSHATTKVTTVPK